MQDTNQELETYKSAKSKGFGSSDADTIYRYGLSGELSTTLKRRVGEIKGEVDRLQFTSKYTDLGNRVEHDTFEWLKSRNDNAINNPYNFGYSFNNFVTSNHIDFVEPGDAWVELKAVKKDNPDVNLVEVTKSKYLNQLAWHKMVMIANGIDLPLQLWVYDTTDCYEDHNRYDFDPFKLQVVTIEESEILPIIEVFNHALNKLDDIWDEIPVFVEQEVIHVTDEEFQQIEAYNAVKSLLHQEKKIKSDIAEFKSKILDMFSDKGVKSIKTPHFTITIKEGHTRTSIDSKKVKADLGGDFEKYVKKTQIKPSVSIAIAK